VIKVLLIRYMCSLRIERKGLKFIQKERKDLLFLGFFEGPKERLNFFFLKKQNHMY